MSWWPSFPGPLCGQNILSPKKKGLKNQDPGGNFLIAGAIGINRFMYGCTLKGRAWRKCLKKVKFAWKLAHSGCRKSNKRYILAEHIFHSLYFVGAPYWHRSVRARDSDIQAWPWS